MNLQVQFFQNDVIKAIKGGVYQILLQKVDGERRVLYIGESFSMLIRCAQHLYQLRKYPEYLGMTTEILRDQNLILMFEILELEEAMGIRRKKEKEYIKKYRPLLQSGLSDRMLPISRKKEAVANFIEI
ncbi:hypothetical protein HO663_05885 [Streptococcus suis]|uniref:GIY-YIG domain-containing protein n=2 Tax=Streptococcus suis TaxID=1307 RepID=A0A123TA58_STRSU|nr:hypothetical protein [Streptococcus suis]MBM7179965.1 hypothetical protein [Streptococcus suis]MCQ9224552.1 hypothetical protein [Streptococcus suis]MCQ9230843.1 hypothetical protein [Streptococcus suis]NQH11875.1 hypothetical protein [Streptococcus suis]NQH27619.1 hypothetical protein [Streptococcus suis]